MVIKTETALLCEKEITMPSKEHHMNIADLHDPAVVTVGLGTSVRHPADVMLNHRVPAPT